MAAVQHVPHLRLRGGAGRSRGEGGRRAPQGPTQGGPEALLVGALDFKWVNQAQGLDPPIPPVAPPVPR